MSMGNNNSSDYSGPVGPVSQTVAELYQQYNGNYSAVAAALASNENHNNASDSADSTSVDMDVNVESFLNSSNYDDYIAHIDNYMLKFLYEFYRGSLSYYIYHIICNQDHGNEYNNKNFYLKFSLH